MITNIINKMNRFKCLSISVNTVVERKNKKLMVDKILSYSPMISDGIAKYNDADKNFWLLLILGGILKDFLMISIPCCALAVFFIIRMFQFIKYKTIYSMVKELADDLLFKGIFNKNKAEHMLKEFEAKYSGETEEYVEFLSMLDRYEKLVVKIESILNSVKSEKENDYYEELEEESDTTVQMTEENNSNITYRNKNKSNERRTGVKKHVGNTDLEKGKEIDWKNIKRAVDLFDGEIDDNKGKAILLKNKRHKDEKLKVYLYKKSSDYQKNIL